MMARWEWPLDTSNFSNVPDVAEQSPKLDESPTSVMTTVVPRAMRT
jgi:hypothetical protein